jgi:hypothetical protein
VYQLNLLKTEFSSIKQHNFIDLKSSAQNLVKQKVNAIVQYKQTQLAVACLSYGYIAVIDFEKHDNTAASVPTKVHKGNITSAVFANDFEYFITASGSFSKNHDNSINVWKVSLAIQELYFKKMYTFSSAHGK